MTGEKSYELVRWPSLHLTLVRQQWFRSHLLESLPAGCREIGANRIMILAYRFDSPLEMDVIAFRIDNFRRPVRQDSYPVSDTAAEPRSADDWANN